MTIENPDSDVTTYIDRGITALNKGDYDKAVMDFSQAIKIKPVFCRIDIYLVSF